MAWTGLFFTRWEHARRRENLSAYLDNALRPDETRRVTAHLDRCPACRAELEDLRAVKAAVQALPRPAPRRSFTLTAPAVAPRQRSAAQLLERRYVSARAASCVLAVILLLVLGFDFVTTPRPSPEPAVSTATRSLPEATSSLQGTTTEGRAAPAAVPDDRARAAGEVSTPPAPAVGAIFTPTELSRIVTPSPAIAAGEVPPTVPHRAPPTAATPLRDLQAEATSALHAAPLSGAVATSVSPDGLAAEPLNDRTGLRVVEAMLAVTLAGTLTVTILLRRHLAQAR